MLTYTVGNFILTIYCWKFYVDYIGANFMLTIYRCRNHVDYIFVQISY